MFFKGSYMLQKMIDYLIKVDEWSKCFKIKFLEVLVEIFLTERNLVDKV